VSHYACNFYALPFRLRAHNKELINILPRHVPLELLFRLHFLVLFRIIDMEKCFQFMLIVRRKESGSLGINVINVEKSFFLSSYHI
jgi:hypothetical protein